MSFYQTNHYQINSYPKNQNLYYDDFDDYESSANKKGNHIYSNYANFLFQHGKNRSNGFYDYNYIFAPNCCKTFRTYFKPLCTHNLFIQNNWNNQSFNNEICPICGVKYEQINLNQTLQIDHSQINNNAYNKFNYNSYSAEMETKERLNKTLSPNKNQSIYIMPKNQVNFPLKTCTCRSRIISSQQKNKNNLMINNNMIIQKSNNQNIMANDDTIKMKMNNNMMPNVLINKNESINMNELNRDFKENSQNNNINNSEQKKDNNEVVASENLNLNNNYQDEDPNKNLHQLNNNQGENQNDKIQINNMEQNHNEENGNNKEQEKNENLNLNDIHEEKEPNLDSNKEMFEQNIVLEENIGKNLSNKDKKDDNIQNDLNNNQEKNEENDLNNINKNEGEQNELLNYYRNKNDEENYYEKENINENNNEIVNDKENNLLNSNNNKELANSKNQQEGEEMNNEQNINNIEVEENEDNISNEKEQNEEYQIKYVKLEKDIITDNKLAQNIINNKNEDLDNKEKEGQNLEKTDENNNILNNSDKIENELEENKNNDNVNINYSHREGEQKYNDLDEEQNQVLDSDNNINNLKDDEINKDNLVKNQEPEKENDNKILDNINKKLDEIENELIQGEEEEYNGENEIKQYPSADKTNEIGNIDKNNQGNLDDKTNNNKIYNENDINSDEEKNEENEYEENISNNLDKNIYKLPKSGELLFNPKKSKRGSYKPLFTPSEKQEFYNRISLKARSKGNEFIFKKAVEIFPSKYGIEMPYKSQSSQLNFNVNSSRSKEKSNMKSPLSIEKRKSLFSQRSSVGEFSYNQKNEKFKMKKYQKNNYYMYKNPIKSENPFVGLSHYDINTKERRSIIAKTVHKEEVEYNQMVSLEENLSKNRDLNEKELNKLIITLSNFLYGEENKHLEKKELYELKVNKVSNIIKIMKEEAQNKIISELHKNAKDRYSIELFEKVKTKVDDFKEKLRQSIIIKGQNSKSSKKNLRKTTFSQKSIRNSVNYFD